jgi:hypothetical protein
MKVPRPAIPVVLTLALLAAPLAAEAQTPQRVIRIGWFIDGPRPPDLAWHYRRFRQEMLALGYVEGRSYVLEYRFADGPAQWPTLAAELVALPVGTFSSVIRPELWRRISQGRGFSPPGRTTPS